MSYKLDRPGRSPRSIPIHVGTLAHTAPEQLEGKETGVPADIFALGTLVYQMVTGVEPFSGDSSASVIAAIMGQEPTPMSELDRSVPRALEHIIWRCLRKAPDEQFRQQYAVFPNGREFLRSVLPEDRDTPPITVILNRGV